MTAVVKPDIQRLGRWFYEVRVEVHPPEDHDNEQWRWIVTATEPPALVWGMRWARWKARRMVAAELRYQGRRAQP